MSTPGTAVAPRPLGEARSLLFVPGDRPERFAKALASGADAVILDLEDAVAPAAKEGARTAIAQAWASVPAAQRSQVLLRTNAAGTPWQDGDLALAAQLATQGLGGLVPAKAESADDLAALAQACPGVAILPLIESARGLDALPAIARAPQVLRLVFGHLDFQSDLGMACGPDEAELLPARWAVVLQSRLAGLAAPVDGVTTALDDPAVLSADTQRSRRLGFGAKLCIHPAQVLGVHRALAPSAAECDWARCVLAAVDAAGNGSGAGAIRVDGRMVDAPVIALARRHLALEFREPGE